MPAMNISLPEALRAFVEGQIAQRRYGTTSEYIRDLIRREGLQQSRVRGCLASSGDAGSRAVQPV